MNAGNGLPETDKTGLVKTDLQPKKHKIMYNKAYIFYNELFARLFCIWYDKDNTFCVKNGMSARLREGQKDAYVSDSESHDCGAGERQR